VRALHPYTPGEQPKIEGLIKINTNENPYPPSPRVLAAIKAATDGRLRLYPDPTSGPLRQQLARLHHCSPDHIIVGNGSDELLSMAVRCFVEPVSGGIRGSKARVQFFTPSYSLYPVLAEIHGAAQNAIPLEPDFDLPPLSELKRARQWDFGAALTFITTPNAPSGRGYRTAQLAELCRAQNGVVVLDEAYVDFAKENALSLALNHEHVLVARTFSKAYSLCFQRVGYFVGAPALISALHKIRDSYNVNGLGQVAASASLDNLGYYRANFRRIIAAREKLSRQLTELNFRVSPSQTNFLWTRPPRWTAEQWLHKLRAHKILVRWFDAPSIGEYLRITIATPQQNDALIRAVRTELAANSAARVSKSEIRNPNSERNPRPEIRKPKTAFFAETRGS
jgi:histidinol-phosphate aminotransferase